MFSLSGTKALSPVCRRSSYGGCLMSLPFTNHTGPSNGRMWENWSPRGPANLVVLYTESPRRLGDSSCWFGCRAKNASPGTASVLYPANGDCWREKRVSSNDGRGAWSDSQHMASESPDGASVVYGPLVAVGGVLQERTLFGSAEERKIERRKAYIAANSGNRCRHVNHNTHS